MIGKDGKGDTMVVFGPIRTCVGCRRREPAAELLRVVASPTNGSVIPDLRHRLPGRGAWLHPRSACLSTANKRRAFERALRTHGKLNTSALEHYVENRREHL